jgi:hypothetical protein
MREYEKEAGEDPDADPDEELGEGPPEWVL